MVCLYRKKGQDIEDDFIILGTNWFTHVQKISPPKLINILALSCKQGSLSGKLQKNDLSDFKNQIKKVEEIVEIFGVTEVLVWILDLLIDHTYFKFSNFCLRNDLSIVADQEIENNKLMPFS